MEFTESRFPHLLQPIRELTKNWEIDVASELNDYLEELDDMCITFDGGKTRLNFAEAALLIQGSACIYSKKVELLHSLVYQTLEYINDRNKKRNKQTSASQEDDADGAASEHDDEAVFTPLNIKVSGNSMNTDSNTTVSVAPLPPESLIPPETSEKHKLPLISVTGDVLCSQKDFRINLFIPGDQDLILLTLGSAASRFLMDVDQIPAESLQQRGTDPRPLEALVEDNGGDAEEDFLPLEDNNMELDQDPEEHLDRHQAPSEGRMIRERREVEEKPARTEETPPPVSVWTLNDPYVVLGEDKPFKSGKCYKVPEGLDDGGKRKRRRAASLQDFRSWFRGTFDPPEHKFKNGPSFPDLNYIYLNTMKNKLKTRKRIYRRAGVAISDEELRRTFLQLEEVGPQQQGEEPMDGFRPPDMLGGDDDNSDQEAFPDDLPAEFAVGPDFISTGAQRDELSYEDLVKLRVEQLVVNCRGYTQETALSRRVKDWEDQIRPELVLQEQRSVFNIHDYGDRIVSSLTGVGQRRSFSSIVSGFNNYEACKYLLASLQLANDLTVEVDSVGGLEDSVDSMGLTLISTHRATDRFKTLTGST
ncbi:condensin-2 complex subunit H2 isoform X1 [Anarrhichthys ocellatus]|uniref:condensin-2 complex subunit H2 isoform X1 n=1 Tax=Anarrhichthys ocellatus TaxID=433405 RepID=UPI0012EEC23E|nr:condensin-2 complex subunit H2 isoform X1 [Anarrhichthys ocellatus]XP_031734709.1 condensin-2 complex subunit H2 isoform X1 [Anarrhichthys ocellatus]XP_031734710.1 condensin-2 complex subunit H2 isoform X1 [Anarrhichthys ocellatus]